MDMRSDSIAAISTPQGRSGIGIIRISGANVLDIIGKFVSSQYSLQKLVTAKKRKLIHARVINQDKEIIDEILLAYLPKKKSFTGEITVELNCHGGRAIMAETLKMAIRSGARLAEPGEFTRRAFENGRLDLVQVEAVNELIQARTKNAIKAAWRQMEGGLTRRCTDLREQLVTVLSEIQARTDFDHDHLAETNQYTKESPDFSPELPHPLSLLGRGIKGEGDPNTPHFSAGMIYSWDHPLRNSLDIIKKMLETAEKSKYLTHGCWVVLSGPPNAGKSSIFNSILNIERAIVSETPGTTRDHISEQIDLDGMEVRLTDTAGMRVAQDEIESISIGKSRQQRLSADIVVYIFDQSIEMSDYEQNEAETVLKQEGFVVFNKSDLEMHKTVKKFSQRNKSNKVFYVSALNKTGIEQFLDQMSEEINEKSLYSENTITLNMRQTQALEKAKKAITEAREILGTSRNLDLAMFELQEGIKALQEIIGEVSTDEILNNIFSKFCIGK